MSSGRGLLSAYYQRLKLWASQIRQPGQVGEQPALTRFRPPPVLFTVPVLGYAVALIAWGGTSAYLLTATVVAAYAAVYSLPWRVPRDDRTPFGYWFETFFCALPLVASVVGWLMLAYGGHTGFRPGLPYAWWITGWLVIGIAVGMVVVRWSGIDLRALRDGDLAFLAGPLPTHRAAARTWIVVVSVFAEEVIFRGVPATITSHRLPAMAVAAVAFVASHHMVRGAEERLRWRVMQIEVGSAVLFGGLVLLSGSVWPAVAAHAVADVPHVTLDFQRARADRTESDQMREAGGG